MMAVETIGGASERSGQRQDIHLHFRVETFNERTILSDTCHNTISAHAYRSRGRSVVRAITELRQGRSDGTGTTKQAAA